MGKVELRDALLGALQLLLLATFIIGFLGGHFYFVAKYFEQFNGLPDLNGDGAFTIADLPGVVFGAATQIGQEYEAILARHPVGQFFEMSSDGSGWFWKTLLTAFAGYFLPIAWYQLANEWLEDRR